MKYLLVLLLSLSLLPAYEAVFKPLPHAKPHLTKKEKLGKRLFNDPILSGDNTISCSSCHPLLNYGMDSLPKAIGINNAKGKRNTPSIWNVRYNFVQQWDGRAKTLKEQALMPIQNQHEMDSTLSDVIKKLEKNTAYKDDFELLYSDGINSDNLADAIASYEKTLISSGSKFDRYLQGDEQALNSREKKGLKLFKSKGCIACHNGINIGGNLYQKIGMFDDFKGAGIPDLGRYNITKNILDKHYFKVPSLRNVEKTAPYFHDGSMLTLKEAVETMVDIQLGRELQDEEIEDLILFLKTLTGDVYD